MNTVVAPGSAQKDCIITCIHICVGSMGTVHTSVLVFASQASRPREPGAPSPSRRPWPWMADCHSTRHTIPIAPRRDCEETHFGSPSPTFDKNRCNGQCAPPRRDRTIRPQHSAHGLSPRSNTWPWNRPDQGSTQPGGTGHVWPDSAKFGSNRLLVVKPRGWHR